MIKKANEVKRYHKKTVEQFMMYLQDIGLSVYGPSMTLEGEELPALMDYDAEHIVARRKHIDKETLWSSEGVSG